MPIKPIINDAAPTPPVQPNLDDCCASGCNPCIFDLYEEEMERYRARLQLWEAKNVVIAIKKIVKKSNVKKIVKSSKAR
ncbi:oxidoreductase-like domain-containing protein [Glaciimonas sp. CA11.2]|uniref:oxidoreductase-like domain-containing protein n=1 Tax=Glaciimonas sp. CA11.2 TaxID=3048601 RepID=UPI002AB336C6|nr:oxidoreductase-like domain-containing protein [Glaciimonas sp. CA11.2]MDY7545922.1 oxidoreductase-like domain-containing protein [Glaciimonas sp. CA11.2]MEB0161419.1 oxidoreductase-like domain-containing protein [Glaciimonas sp. CA11.2]